MSNMDRSTKEIVLPCGSKAVIFDYISGGELRKVQSLYMRGMKAGDLADVAGASPEEVGKEALKNLDASVIFEAQELVLKLMLRSIDGCEPEQAYERAMALRPEDLTVILKELEEYTTGAASKKKSTEPS